MIGWFHKRQMLKRLRSINMEAAVYRRAYELLKQHGVNDTDSALGLLEHAKLLKKKSLELSEQIRN